LKREDRLFTLENTNNLDDYIKFLQDALLKSVDNFAPGSGYTVDHIDSIKLTFTKFNPFSGTKWL